jgi:hypothetical protein
MVEILIAGGVEISTLAANGKTALDIAKAYKNTVVIPLLSI